MSKKLTLKTETITVLSTTDLDNARGGVGVFGWTGPINNPFETHVSSVKPTPHQTVSSARPQPHQSVSSALNPSKNPFETSVSSALKPGR